MIKQINKRRSHHLHLAFWLALLLGVVLFFVNRHVDTGQSTSSLTVTANVNARCIFQGGGGQLNFGEYDPIVVNASSPLDATGSFDVKCTKNITCQLGIDYGLNSPGGTTRRLSSGGVFLSYDIYKEASRANIWGPTGALRVPYTATTSQYYTETVYGRIPGGQDVTAGSYTDTCVITADF